MKEGMEGWKEEGFTGGKEAKRGRVIWSNVEEEEGKVGKGNLWCCKGKKGNRRGNEDVVI